MAQAPKKAPDRHYDFRGLNIVFAWSSVALLAVTLWMVFDDYAKPWKRLQAEFRDLERQKLLAETEAERQSLNDNEMAQIAAEIEAEETGLEGQGQEIRELEESFDALGKKVYAADAISRTTKSLLDTARYQFDVALQSGVDKRMAAARAKVDELQVEYLENRKALEAYSEQQRLVEAEIDQKHAGRVEAEKRLAALRSGLDGLQQRMAGLDKKIDYFVLNAPLMDFIEPDLKIEQVILSGLFQDINFTAVDRVDRCMTCHAAVGRAGFDSEEWGEPFRSHPRLDLYVGAASPHPYTEFGCTTCHGGLDRATDFARAGHSPRNEEQKAEWIERWGWEPQKYLEDPILPGGLSEARCNSCHADNIWTPGSDRQDAGRELISRMGCFGCHLIDYPAFNDLPRPGPTLKRVASKTKPAWAYKWIEAPREFRPTTWMPHFFFQENIKGELNMERQRAEIRGLVAYIWDHSETLDYPAAPAGNAANGEQFFDTIGCTGCHLRDGEATRDQFFPQINRMHGPNLVGAGSKLDADWLFAWLKNPKAYNPDTRMPSLRLTDREAADIVAFLMSSRKPEFENLEIPTVDPSVRDELVTGYLQNTQTIEQSEASLAAMSDDERDVYLGGQTIRKYGCFACHEVEGFDDAKPIGVELTEEGSKPIHQFDFGHIHDIAHTRQDWIRTKMLRPRIWDHGKEEVKGYHELYRMPDFGMSEREAEAVVTNVLGFTEESVLASRRAGRTAAADALASGRRLITRYNCQGCHLVEAKGHAIRTSIEDVGMLPPNLAAEGARVQSKWLFDYLHDPGKVSLRPWLSVRMPTFGFSDEDVNTLLSYFSSREEREPFLSPPTRPDARYLDVGRTAFNMFQCAKCHPAGPQPEGGAVSAGELAPSLLLARERLRHDWVADWIKDPQSWVPGTKMPANFTRLESGEYASPLANAIDAPMFSGQKKSMMKHFGSEEELKEFLADTDEVTRALRDHIFWNLAGGP